MDVFYYWKEFEKNIDEGMIGRFVSSKEQLDKLKDRPPDYIWAFIIPKGRRGQRGKGEGKLRLLAKLRWSDKPLPGLPASDKEEITSEIYYDHKAADSILYKDTDSDDALELVTGLMKPKYPQAFNANFQGPNGVQVMEQDFVDKFNREIARYSSIQFLNGIARLWVSK